MIAHTGIGLWDDSLVDQPPRHLVSVLLLVTLAAKASAPAIRKADRMNGAPGSLNGALFPMKNANITVNSPGPIYPGETEDAGIGPLKLALFRRTNPPSHDPLQCRIDQS